MSPSIMKSSKSEKLQFSSTMLLTLLGVGATASTADYAWVLRRALAYLLPVDAARLVVALLDSARDGSDARARVHSLRFGDSPLPPMLDDDLLDAAAAHGCWRALVVLLEDLLAKSPPWVTLHDDRITDADALSNDVQVQRATIAHRGTHYRFGHEVLGIAATRGDLKTLQWLWSRAAVESGQVEPTRRGKGDRDEESARAEAVLKAAADALHFHIIEWAIKVAPLVDCVLPYDDELEAVCWIEWSAPGSRWCTYCCATKKYGFSRMHARNPASADGMNPDRVTEMPLADAFARDGDLDTLKKIFARPNYPQLISSNSIGQAAERGHLDVVKWLHKLLPKKMSLLSACFVGAVRGGHMPILEWIHQELDFPLIPQARIDAAARGHVQVLRWYQSIAPTENQYIRDVALNTAVRNGHVDAVKYLHEELGTPLLVPYIDGPLAKCSSIEMFDYVLDHAEPLRRPSLFLKQVIQSSSLVVVKHLVLNRGLWSSEALSAAVNRLDPDSTLEMSQFLYGQAQERARHMQTPLNDQLDVTPIEIGYIKHYPVALWLLQCVPGVAVCGHYYVLVTNTYVREPSWIPIFLACLKYRPDECRKLSTLPEWAVRVNSFDTFELLEQCGHPQLRHSDTFHAIIEHSRDARFMLKLLPLPDDNPNLRHDVIEWAAKYGMLAVLDRVFDHEDPRIQCQLVKRVAHHVGVSGHVEMGDWLLKRLSTLQLSITAILKGVDSKAVCHGHTQVLGWLRGHQLMPTRPQAIESLMLAAGTARQVRSLQWLVSNSLTEVPPKAVVRVLLDGVRQNHTEVVHLITRKFDPDALPVRAQDLDRVGVYLRKQQPRADGPVAEAMDSIEDDKTASGRQSKRSRRK